MRIPLLVLALSLFALVSGEARSQGARADEPPAVIKTRGDAIRVMDEIDDHMAELSRLQADMQNHFNELSELWQKLAANPTTETAMSLNLQYLQLQQQMQNENRQYTAVSNIMKTKHDTVKNSISNIR
jgi:hypothetical protein